MSLYVISMTASMFLLILCSCPAFSQAYPDGFSHQRFEGKVNNPTALAFAPDGRIFVTEQSGGLRIIKDDVLLSKPALQLNVNVLGERGLLGIVLDPNFSTNKYVYVYYTIATAAYNRVSRFTLNGDTVLANSEKIILDLDSLSTAVNHNGGALHFGKDNKLYIATGENAFPEHSQNLDTYHGKLLRINPDGTVPAGNPFSAGSEQKKRIWAYGLRNPFTFSVHPKTGRIFVNDVGQSGWEEINEVTTGGGNYAWPKGEGKIAEPGYINPVYIYQRTLAPSDSNGCAITGGVFFDPVTTNYPARYKGKYFFVDFCNRWINYIDPAGGYKRFSFGQQVAIEPLGLTAGPDGNLYFLSRRHDAVYKIVYSALPTPPAITSQPASATITRGQTATFSVKTTGSAPLQYQWQKNGVNIAGATDETFTINTVQMADTGRYRVIVSNIAGKDTSIAALLSVNYFNTSPVAVIINPVSGTLYKAGQTIQFSGSATDKEDGTLPASIFSWEVVFYHDTHSHDGPPIAVGVKNGSFQIPNSGETDPDVWYRLYLTVTDTDGAVHKVFRDIYPVKTTISFSTQPAGLEITLDGQPVKTPASVISVAGFMRPIGAELKQMLNGIEYQFAHWKHGGTQNQVINVPDTTAALVAVFKPVLRNADNPLKTVNVLKYAYYKGNWSNLPDFATLTASKRGFVSNFNLSVADTSDYYALQFTGYINVPADGIYTFYTSSDDGSRLFIGNKLVVANGGIHAKRERTGKIGLKKGKHAISVTYFENTGNQALDVAWAGPGIVKQFIPSSALFAVPDNIPGGAFSKNIIFQPANRVVPNFYHVDTGAIYGIREDNLMYGWSKDNFNAELRNVASQTDVRYNTLNYFQKEGEENLLWEIALPNGAYLVKLISSDLLYTNQINSFLVEGTMVNDPDGYDLTDEYITPVTVMDGRLTLQPSAGAQNAKISYVSIRQLSATGKVDFAKTITKTENSQILVYPNPATDVIHINFTSKQAEQAEIIVTDVLSRRVYIKTQSVEAGQNKLSLQTQGWQAGTYLLQIQTSTGRLTHKMTITK